MPPNSLAHLGPPLFLQGPPLTPASGSLPLVITGNTSGASGLYRVLPLIVNAVSGNVVTRTHPLFLAGASRGGLSGQLPLTLPGGTTPVSRDLTLILKNNLSAATGLVPLLVLGSGTTPGAIPVDSRLNLFLHRWPAAALSLFLQGPGSPTSSGLSLLALGGQPVSGSLSLAIPNVVGPMSSDTPLYICGF